MNPFLNPLTGIPFLKHFMMDASRIQRYSAKKMKKFRDKTFKRTVKYAYGVPLYYKTYEKAGVKLHEITVIDDAVKLPLITKNDIINNFPDDIIPPHYDKKKAEVVCTSGSTGKPVSFYVDFSTMSGCVGIAKRELELEHLHWRKSKFAHIGNFSADKADIASEKAFFSKAQSFYSLNNYLRMNCFDPIQDIIKQLDTFQPDIIMSYPSTFQQLAYFKNKGFGKNINPKVLKVGGYVLDEYTRSYVQDAFHCQMLNVYASAESCGDIAFECSEGTWHINHDFFHVEAIDENMNIVEPGERGHIVITRMFGKGTPFVRYTGMDDWVVLSKEYECDCGLCTPTLKSGVEGRMSTSVVLPDGRIYPSASFAILSVVLNDLKTRKVKQFQIVQNKIDEIDILLVIDDDLRSEEPSLDFLFKKITEVYQKKVGSGVAIRVKEVKEIKSEKGKPSPLVISKIKQEEGLRRIKIKK